MTGVKGSVGGENWCVYADLDAYCDTASIMSYGMAWAGSAPGPVSPRSWLEEIYNYASKVSRSSVFVMAMAKKCRQYRNKKHDDVVKRRKFDNKYIVKHEISKNKTISNKVLV